MAFPCPSDYICVTICLIGNINFWCGIAGSILVLRFNKIVSFYVFCVDGTNMLFLHYFFVTRYVFLILIFNLFENFMCQRSAIIDMFSCFNCRCAIIGLQSSINFCVLNSWSAIIDEFLCFQFLKYDHWWVLVFSTFWSAIINGFLSFQLLKCDHQYILVFSTFEVRS